LPRFLKIVEDEDLLENIRMRGASCATPCKLAANSLIREIRGEA